MSIQDDLARVLPELRRHAESSMTSTCTIRRPAGGAPAYGPDGDQIVSQTTVYSGPCEVKDGGTRRITVGGTESEQAIKKLKLPAGTSGLKDADVAHIDSGDAAGVSLRLLEVTPADHQTALRIPCVEV